jgi:hypothetical protein
LSDDLSYLTRIIFCDLPFAGLFAGLFCDLPFAGLFCRHG